MRNRCGSSPDVTIRNCCAVHSAVGWSVTFHGESVACRRRAPRTRRRRETSPRSPRKNHTPGRRWRGCAQRAPLRRSRAGPRGAISRRHVPPDRPWRRMDPELDEQFGGDPSLAPGPIRRRHLHNQLSHSGEYRRPPAWWQFQPSEQPIRVAMPWNKLGGLHDSEDPTPIHQPR